MGRTPCCDMMGIRKGPWSVEEDRKLIDYIQKHGYGNWRAIPKQAGVMRCGKSCRLRWMNYLRPNLKRGSLSSEEEQTIYRLHGILGNKWSTIASYLPGRTDNEIKNIWNTRLRKRLAQSESGKNLTHSSSPSTMPTTPAEAVNNSLPNSPPMQISHLQHDIPLVSSYSPNHNGRMERNDFVQVCQQGPYFADAHEQLLLPSIAGSPILSTSKDSADQIKLSGTKYSAGKDIIDDQRDGNSSAHDYINFLKNFLDINEESSVISPYELHQDADATFTVESHHFDNEERTLQPQKCFSVEHGRSEDHITTAVFCWNSPFSGNQFDHEILQTSFADSKVAYSYSPNSSSTNNPMSFDSKVAYSYSPNSSSTNNPMSLSLDFLVDFPEKMWRAF